MATSSKRTFIFILLTGGLVLVALIAIVTAAEFYFRTFQPPPPIAGNRFQLTSGVRQELDSVSTSESKRISTHVPIDLPQHPQFKGRPVTPPPTLKTKSFSPGYFTIDPVDGSLTPPAGIYRSTAITTDGHSFYDVEYTIDKFRRRLTPNENPQQRIKTLLFMGCSFTFGEGLKDSETLPAYSAEFAPIFYSVNLSFHAWGPGNILRAVTRPQFADGIPNKQGKAIYVFIDNHMARVIGNLSLTRAVPHWRKVLPYYDLDRNGKLLSDRTMESGQPWQSLLFSWLAKSQLLSYFHVDIPARFSDRDFTLFATVIQNLKQEVQKNAGLDDFYVLIYPGSILGPALEHYLDKMNIQSINYSRVALPLFLETPPMIGDGHPTADTNRFLAKQLVHDLDLADKQQERN